MAAVMKTAPAIPSRSSARCAPFGRTDRPMSVRLSCHDWTTGGNTPDDAEIFADHVQGSRRRPYRLFVRSGVEGGAAGLRPPVPDAVLRQDPQRGADRHHRGRRDFRSRPRSIRSSPRDAPIFARSPGRIWPIPPGRCTRPPRSASRPSPGRSNIHSAKAQYEANLARAAAARRGGEMSAASPLAGRHALVTGAGSGIGAAIARALARRRRARQPGRSPRETAGRSGGLLAGRSGVGRRRLRRD